MRAPWEQADFERICRSPVQKVAAVAITAMASPTLVVIAASAGGVQALGTLLKSIPKSFPVPIAVIMHRGAGEPERLPILLRRLTSLEVRNAVEGEPLEAGVVYLCPPGMHMTAVRAVHLSDAPKLKHVRPSADLMLESVARSFGAGAVAVVLSGSGRDAALGTVSISQHGGTVLVQEPSSCGFSGMPDAAIAQGCVDSIVPLEQLGYALRRLVAAPADTAVAAPTEPLPRLLLPDYRSDGPRMTSSERELLRWLVEGVPRELIAYRLHIDAGKLHAVEARILHKLGIDNAAALVRYATREGLSDVD